MFVYLFQTWFEQKIQGLSNGGKCGLLVRGGELMDKNKDTLAQPLQPLVNRFRNMNSSIFTTKLLIVLIAVMVLGGVSGLLLSKRESLTVGSNGTIISSSTSKGAIVGSDDKKTFKDTVTGVLKSGGANGEGQFHLVRPGGDSQNVYLTSSTLDLSKFVDKKITVWGQTQQAQYAGWLMDVGRVEVL